MTLLSESGIGQDSELDSRTLWERTRRLLGPRLTYAFADQVVYSFGNMIVAALLSRHSAAREFGIYILTQRALDLIIQLCNVFLWGPLAYNLASTEENRRSLYRGSVFMHQLVACGGATLVMWAATSWSSTPSRGLYYGVFYPLVAASAGIVFREYTRRMYFCEIRMKEAFWTDVATVVLQIAGVEYLYLAHRLNVTNTLWILSLGAVLVSLWWLAREWRRLTFGFNESLADMRRNMRLGRWFLGANMVFMASSQLNPWLLSGLLGGVSVGAYAICESVVNIPRVALTSMQNMMAPTMARAYAEGGKSELRRQVHHMDRLLFAGATIFGIIIYFLGPAIATVIYKKNVPADAHIILLLLVYNFVAYAATMAQSYALSAIDKAGYTFYANLAGLIAQVGVSFWLVRHFNVPGAAAALLIGSVTVMAVRQFFYTRQMHDGPAKDPQAA
jgi:O-antigen/teichoic acid export membrane protein